MDCRFIKENLFAIAEKRLPENELARVSEHVETCGGCKEMIGFFARMEEGIRELKETEPGPFVSTRTLAMLEKRYQDPVQQKGFPARLILQPAVISLFMGLAIFAGILFGSYGFRQHDRAAAASETELLLSELGLGEVASEESGFLMMEEEGISYNE